MRKYFEVNFPFRLHKVTIILCLSLIQNSLSAADGKTGKVVKFNLNERVEHFKKTKTDFLNRLEEAKRRPVDFTYVENGEAGVAGKNSALLVYADPEKQTLQSVASPALRRVELFAEPKAALPSGTSATAHPEELFWQFLLPKGLEGKVVQESFEFAKPRGKTPIHFRQRQTKESLNQNTLEEVRDFKVEELDEEPFFVRRQVYHSSLYKIKNSGRTTQFKFTVNENENESISILLNVDDGRSYSAFQINPNLIGTRKVLLIAPVENNPRKVKV